MTARIHTTQPIIEIPPSPCDVRTRVIGIAGRIHSGKTTVADRLQSFEEGWAPISFADPVRAALIRLNPIIDVRFPQNSPEITFIRLADAIAKLGWDRAKQECKEIRRLMVLMGTDVGREIIAEDCWLDIAQPKVAMALSVGMSVVIPDVRFVDEVNMIHEFGGYVIFMDRPGLPPLPGKLARHRSEQLTENHCDITFVNDGALEDLHRVIDTYIRHMPMYYSHLISATQERV